MSRPMKSSYESGFSNSKHEQEEFYIQKRTQSTLTNAQTLQGRTPCTACYMARWNPARPWESALDTYNLGDSSPMQRIGWRRALSVPRCWRAATLQEQALDLSGWVKALDMNHPLCVAESAHPCFVAPRFGSNREQALRPITDEGKTRARARGNWPTQRQ